MVQLLVDNQSPNKKFAFTSDAGKIAKNRNLLRSVPFSHSIKVLGPNNGTVSLFSVGKYISVVRIGANGTPDKMYFFDFDWDISKSELQILLQSVYSSELEKEWFNIQWILYSTFDKEMDNVEILKQ
ncbi:MAG TPA: hypothetical protein VD908_17815 [Cytophagales bacterium]|nr:hypothetical protein [Cytophagales bacterium]